MGGHAAWERALVKRIKLATLLRDADPAHLDPPAPMAALRVDVARARLVVGVGLTLHAFDLRTGVRVQEYAIEGTDLDPLGTFCHLLQITPDGRHLVVALSMGNGGEGYGYARVFDVATGACVAAPAMPDHLMAALLDPAGELLACVDPWSVGVHRVADGARLARSDERAVEGCAWDPTTGSLLLMTDQGLAAHDPRTLAEARRVASPRAVAPAGFAYHARANPAAPAARVDAGLAALELPWGLTLFADPTEQVLWLADDAAAAIVHRNGEVLAHTAAAPPRLVTRAPAEGPLHTAVSDDGALVAVHQKGTVTLHPTGLRAPG